MAFATTTFKLDLTPGASRPVIYASAGDIGRPFTASLYWNGEAWTPGTATPVIRGKKPDKTVFEYNGLTVSNNAVTFETQEQMTIIPGPVECELVFTDGTDIVASANFVLIVEDSPYDPDALSESDVYTLTELVIDAIGDAITTALENNMIDTAHIDNLAVTTAKVAANAITWEKLAVAVQNRITTLESGLTDLEERLSSGDEDDAGLHLGFYLDSNGDLCQVEED